MRFAVTNLSSLFVLLALVAGCSRGGSKVDTGFLAGVELTASTTELSVSSSSVIIGQNVRVKLTTRDQNGNAYKSPTRLTVVFSLGSGTSVGTFSAVTVADDGSYSADFTGTTIGNATEIEASIDGTNLSLQLPKIAVMPDPAATSLSIGSATANEGSALTFNVTLSQAWTQAVTVHYASANGTASAGTQYTATSGTLTIAAGSTTGTITVPTQNDGIYNSTLTMQMVLSSATNASITTASGTGTINNLDAIPSVVINDVSVSEGSGSAFTVSVNRASYQDITVDYATSDVTAVAGTNYTTKTGTATILAGSLSTTVTVATLDDHAYETGGLTYQLNLSNPVHATISDNVGLGTVTNVDSMPTVQFAVTTQSVNQSPSTQTLTITAQLSAASGPGTLTTVPFTVSGTASSPSHYTIAASSISIPAGSTSGTVVLTAVNSGAVGVDRTVILTVGTPTNATAGTNSVDTVTVVNNNYPSVTFAVATQDVAINQGTSTVTVNVSPAPVKTVSVPIVIDGSSTAVSGTDYALTAPTLTFASGVTSQTFTVNWLDQLTPATANAALVLKLGTLANGVAGTNAMLTSTIRQPALDLNFATMYDPVSMKGAAPFNQITFTRASTGTYTDCDGFIKVAAAGVPRIDCNPTSGQPYGVLVEESRTNIAFNSGNLLDTSTWGYQSGLTATLASVAAPDGSYSAATLNGGYISQNKTIPNDSNPWTCSAYVYQAAAASAALKLQIWGGTSIGLQTTIDWASHTITTDSGAKGTITNQGSGWYRISVSFANNASGNVNGSCYLFANASSTVTAWGVQMEAGAFPTSYIPTLAANSTRAAEVYSASSLSSWNVSGMGTVYSQAYSPPTVPATFSWFPFEFDDGTYANRIYFYDLNLNYGQQAVTSAGVQVNDQRAYASSNTVRQITAYNTNDFLSAADGVSLGTSTSGAVPTVTQFNIGRSPVGGNIMDGAVSRFTSYGRRIATDGVVALSGTTTFRTFKPTVNLTTTTQTLIDSQGTVYVTASLNEPATAVTTVPYTVGGTAVANTNYTGLSDGAFTFPIGKSRSTISFNLKDDGGSTNPTITVTLGTGSAFTVGANNVQTMTILRPTLDFNFAALYDPANQLSVAPFNQITFARLSVGTYVDADGLIKKVATNVARVDHDPITHQPNGLLVEEVRTNLLLQTQAMYTAANWPVKSGTTTTSATTTAVNAPDGSLMAAVITDITSATGNKGIGQGMSGIANATPYTFTMFAHAGPSGVANQYLRVQFGGGAFASANACVLFTLSGQGTAANTGGCNTTGVSSSITAFANGWYRLRVTDSATAAGGGNVDLFLVNSAGNLAYAGDGSSFYVWGAQLEAGSFATSYIPTTAATVTRAGDDVTVSAGSWFNSTSGSVVSGGFTEYATTSTGTYPAWFEFYNTNSERMELFNSPSTAQPSWESVTASGGGANPVGRISTSNLTRYAVAYGGGNFSGSGAASYPATFTANPPTGVTQLFVGSLGYGNYLSGAIPRFTYYPVRLSNLQLQNLSASSTYGPRPITPTVTLTKASQSVLQTDAKAYFVASLSQPAPSTITVPYTITGTAANPADYTSLASGTLTFTAGQSRAVASLTLVANASTGKTVIMTLGSPTGATLGSLTAETITIDNPSATTTLAAAAQSSNGSTVTFTGTCDPALGTVSVSGAQSSTATCLANGTYSWTTASTSTDGIYSYTFTQTDTFGNIATVVGTWNRFSVVYASAIADAAINQGTISVTVNLSAASSTTTTVPITVTGASTGVSGTDYTLGATTLTFAAGTTTQSFNLTILDQLSPATNNATVVLGFGSITNGAAGATATSTITIRQPALDLNFASVYDPTNQMSVAPFNQITFTRASTGTYVDCDGMLKTAAVNVARMECDYANGKSLGLLVEESRTNLMVPSAWPLGANAHLTNVTSNVVAPDGMSYAVKLVEDTTATTTHFSGRSFTMTAGAVYSYSVYLKAGERSQVIFYAGKGSSPYTRGGLQIDLAAGTFTNSDVSTPTSVTNRSLVALANGWYRATITVTTDGTSTDGYIELRTINGGTVSYTGDGSSGLYVWGTQLEAAASPSSFIPTTTVAGVRAGDSALIATPSTWFNGTVATQFSQYDMPYSIPGTFPGSFGIDDGTGNNAISIYSQTLGAYAGYTVKVGGTGVSTGIGSGATQTYGASFRNMLAVKNNDFQDAINGSLYMTTTGVSLPTGLNKAYVGQLWISAGALNGHVARVSSYQQRLPNAVLQTLSNGANSYRGYKPTVNLTTTTQTVIESQKTATIIASLNEPATATINVPFTVGGTAVSGTHYSGLVSGNFTFAAGQNRATKTITLIDNGTTASPTISVTLSTGTGFTLGANSAQTITIQRPSLDLNFAAMYDPATQMGLAPYNQITFTRGSSATYFDCDGTMRSVAANIPRIDCDLISHQPRGILLEEARTNAIPNSLASGAAAGSPGTMPTGWGRATSPTVSVSSQVIGFGNEFGMPYVDVRWYGTPDTTTTGINFANFTTTNSIPALSGQTWTFSAYVKIVGGSTTNLAALSQRIRFLDSSFSNIDTQDYPFLSAVSSTYTRVSATRTPGLAATAWLYPWLAFGTTLGSPIDITLRIAAPQVEQGAYVTSFIPTSTAAVTRAADLATVNSSGWYSTAQGSMLADYFVDSGRASSNNQIAFQLDDATGNNNNRFTLFAGTSMTPTFKEVSGGATNASLASPALPAGVSRVAIVGAYANNDFASAFSNSASTIFTATSGTVPTGVSLLTIGGQNAGSQANDPIDRVTFYPTRLPSSVLGLLSASPISVRTSVPAVSLTRATQSVLQSDGSAFFTLALSQPATGTITVPYTIAGTAVSGTDFSGLASGTLTFTMGQSRAVASMTLNSNANNARTVIMNLGTPTGATLGTNSTETIVITNVTTGLALSSSSVYNNGSTVTFSGTCAPGMTILITGQETSSTTCSAGGTWSWTSSTVSSDGSYTYNFRQNDGLNSSGTIAGTYGRDTNPPSAVGSLLDGNTTSLTTASPTMTWTAATDSGTGATGINHYELAIGTSAGGTQTLGWTNIGNVLTYQKTGLSLTNGSMYYGSVRAVDNAGNISSVSQGDGFAVVIETPTLSLNFMGSTMPVQVQFSNLTGAGIVAPTYTNAAGVLTSASQNILTYSQNFGNVAWEANGGTVATTSAVNAPDGTTTAYKLIEASGSGYFGYRTTANLMNTTGNYCASAYMKAAERTQGALLLQQWGGSYPNASVLVNLTAGSPTIVNEGFPTGFTKISTNVVDAGNGWARVSICATLSLSNNAKLLLYPAVSGSIAYTGNGASGIYIWGAQLEQASTVANYAYTNGTTSYTPRLDYDPVSIGTSKGLLIEDSSANYIRNNTMVGAAAGTPGTFPTNWSSYITNGLSRQVVGSGVSNGVSYVDVRVYGTATATGFSNISFETATGIAGSNGQSWAHSAYLAVASGSMSGFTLLSLNASVSDSSSAYLGELTGSVSVTPTATLTRYGFNGAITFSTAAYVGPYLQMRYNNGAVVDMTLRIGMPQFEHTQIVTSVIPTSGAVATRSADDASVNGMSWLGASQGTLVANAMAGSLYFNLNHSAFAPQIVASLEKDTSNRLMLRRFNSSVVGADGCIGGVYYAGASTILSNSMADGTWPSLTVRSLAIAYQNNSFAGAGNGILNSSVTSGTPFTPTQLVLGHSAYYGNYLGGWLQSVQYYGTRLSDAATQELTHP